MVSAGGFTTVGGKSFLVTPGGKVVGTADPTLARPRRGGGPSPPPSSGTAAREAELARAREALAVAQRLAEQAAAERKRAADLRAADLARRQAVAERARFKGGRGGGVRPLGRPDLKPRISNLDRVRISKSLIRGRSRLIVNFVKAEAAARGRGLTRLEIERLLSGREKSAVFSGAKIVPVEVGDTVIKKQDSRLVVSEFVRPSFTRRQRIRLSNVFSEIVSTGKRLGENKKSIDKEISDRLKKLGVTDENINKFSVRLDKLDFTKELLPIDITTKLGIDKLLISARVGFVKGLRDQPTTAAATFSLGKALPSVTKFLGGTKVIKKAAGFIPGTIKKIGSKTIPPALVTSYAASSGLQVAKQPKGKRAEEVGKIFATEVIPFKLGTRSGVRGLLRSELQTEIKKSLAKLPKRKQAAFKELIEKAELLKRTKVFLRNVNLKKLRRIPDEAKPTILRFLKEKDIILGGSVGQATTIKPKRTMAQSDLDLYSKKDPVSLAKELTKRLQNLGIKRVVRTGREVRIAGKKAAEFQKFERILANIESVIPRWRSPSSFIVRGKDGIRVPKITIQLKRKIIGGFTDPRRAKRTDFKDLKDAKDILDKMFKKAELQARQKFFFREQNIKALENKFGVKISRKPVKTIPTKEVPPTRRPPVRIAPKKVPPKKVIPTRRPPALKRNAKGQFVKRARPSQAPSQRPRPSQIPIRGFPSQPPVRRRPTRGGPSQPPTRRPPTRGGPTRRPDGTGGPPPSRRDFPSQQPVPKRKTGPPPTPRVRILRKPTKKVPPEKLIGFARAKKKLAQKGLKQGFNVFGKSGKKFFKLNKSPMEKSAALDRGSFAVDKTTSRTFKIVPAARVREFLGNKKNIQGHFQKNRNKLRNFRVVKGKRKLLNNKFIELTKHAIDDDGEVSGLSIAKLRRQKFGFSGGSKKVPQAKLRSLVKARKKLAEIRRPQVRRPSPNRLKSNIPRRPTRGPPALRRNKAGQFVKRR